MNYVDDDHVVVDAGSLITHPSLISFNDCSNVWRIEIRVCGIGFFTEVGPRTGEGLH